MTRARLRAKRAGVAAAGFVAPCLVLRYGHFPYLWSRTGAMDRSFAVFLARPDAARASNAPGAASDTGPTD